MPAGSPQIPVIDLAPLLGDDAALGTVAGQIACACRDNGFFAVIGHGVSELLQQDLTSLSRAFFALPLAVKMRIAMPLGGRAWRGFFPVGQELTSGRPDLKEGLYFGAELDEEHALVRAGTPLHGRNLFPEEPVGMRAVVLAYIEAMTGLGHTLMAAIAVSLQLPASYFHDRYTHDPLTLFRIFHYPAAAEGDESSWGVGEHTDYGVLTILKQDDVGGLQVQSRGQWVDVAPIPGSFICNIGDMLDRMTGGLYRSTAHRVRNRSRRSRLSFPFFFDPNFNAEVRAIEGLEVRDDDRQRRWDGASVHAFQGTYGDYLLAKVAKVFPDLRRSSL